MQNEMIELGISPDGNSLVLHPRLRGLEFKKVEQEGVSLWIALENKAFWVASGDPREILPQGVHRYTISMVHVADRSKPIGLGNINDCVQCTHIKDDGHKVSPECIHIRAARKLAFNQ